MSQIHQVGVPRDAFLDQDFLRAYGYATLGEWGSLSLSYEQIRLTSDDDGFNPLQLANSVTDLVPIELRGFVGSWFASGKITFVNQSGQFCDFSQPPPSPNAFCATAEGSDNFSVLDMQLGVLLPRRRGLVSFGVLNALDSEFRFQDLDPNNSSFARDRVVFVRATLQL